MSKGFLRFKNVYESGDFDGTFVTFTDEQLKPITDILSLSSDLLDWYRVAAPCGTDENTNLEIPLLGNPLGLFDPMTLVSMQLGYKWIVVENQKTEDSMWDKNWVVIGDIGGDPIIAHTDRGETPISMALHGVGYWSLQETAPSLTTFLASLTIWLQIFMKNGGKICDEDSVILPMIVDEMKSALSSFLSQQQVDNFMYYVVDG